MEVIYTDARWRDVGVLRDMRFDVDFGDESNTFELTLPADSGVRVEDGALVYVEGTEYGGRATKPGVRTAKGELVYGGRSWHGLLEERHVCPAAGQDYFSVSGEANGCIATVLDALEDGGLFAASEADTKASLSYNGRYAGAWSFIRRMLATAGMRPALSYERGVVTVSAVPTRIWDTGAIDVEMDEERLPKNHLICLGKGELRNRTRIDLYADREGNVSQTQTIFGIDYRDDVYEYTNAEADELLKAGIEKLQDLQHESRSDLSVGYESPEDSYGIGDTLYKMDDVTGVSASLVIGQKTVTVNSKGDLSVTYGPQNGKEQAAVA